MVRQCVCYRVTFEELREVATRVGSDLNALHQATGAGGRCGLCIPYIRYMLLTGSVEIPVIWTDDFRRLNIKCATIERVEKRLRAEHDGTLPHPSCAPGGPHSDCPSPQSLTASAGHHAQAAHG